MFETLQRGWNKNLINIFQTVQTELTISSPYISNVGAEFLLTNVSNNFKENGVLKFLTDLSPRNIYQGSTEPKSFKLLSNSIKSIQLFHLPRLHAKVYISDGREAIITSGNLTAGGIYNNFEYGIFSNHIQKIAIIKNDLLDYANLGAIINSNDIDNYCKISEEIKKIYKEKEKSTNIILEKQFKNALAKANDELIRATLSGGALHSVFERTIIYLLKKNGPLPTTVLHNLIEEMHPDLCDNNVDRIINEIHFGKKWKHAVRTAQQQLKKKNLIILEHGLWRAI